MTLDEREKSLRALDVELHPERYQDLGKELEYRVEGPLLHHLKTWPEFYTAIAKNEKTFDIRRDDRGFKVGDFLMLCEYLVQSKTFTGHIQFVEVTYILKGVQWGIMDGFAILGLKHCTAESVQSELQKQGERK
jgi:hypothetical protein